MNIRMYNCYFGDCFNIANLSGSDLLVDFGIHNSCTNKNVRDLRFQMIYFDICDKDMDFLLSHYHEDHYNGVEYINKNYNYKFKDVYIPDIWSFNGCIKAIELHLLRGILDKSFLNRKTTIFSFLKAICNNHSMIHFVQRGYLIEDRFIALWPTKEFIKQIALKVLSKALDKVKFDENDISNLEFFSIRLQEIVNSIHSHDLDQGELLNQIESLETEFLGFVNNFKPKPEWSRVKYNLCKFENDISIVFQNIDNKGNENLLFTGDFGSDSKLWTYIENNADCNPDCYLFNSYHAIKVGHHGTRPYYHSFANIMNNDSILLIPNDGLKMNWVICSDYSLNAINYSSKTICSTNKSCEAKNNNNGICTCINKIIIQPSVYTDIV